MAGIRLATVVAVADADVSEGGRGADRGSAWKRRLRTPFCGGPMASAAADRHDAQPIRLRSAAEGGIGSGPHGAGGRAGRCRSARDEAADRSGVRSTPKDAAV